jgi:hypothetical protein
MQDTTMQINKAVSVIPIYLIVENITTLVDNFFESIFNISRVHLCITRARVHHHSNRGTHVFN